MFRHIFNNNSYVKRQQTPRKRKKIEPLNENNDETEDVNDIIVDMGQQLSDLKQLINLTLFDEILDSIDEDISIEEIRLNNNDSPPAKSSLPTAANSAPTQTMRNRPQ